MTNRQVNSNEMLFVGRTSGRNERARLYLGEGRNGSLPIKWLEARKNHFLDGATDEEIIGSAEREARSLFSGPADVRDYLDRHRKSLGTFGTDASKRSSPRFVLEIFPWHAHPNALVRVERVRRDKLWRSLTSKYPGGFNVPKKVLNDSKIYYDGSSCWVDKQVTTAAEQTFGITVSVLHTGFDYPDDLGDDGLIYHYPVTGRPTSRDLGEIDATKNCARFGIPLFVVTSGDRDLPSVRRGWVMDWNDKRRSFFISFSPGEKAISEPESQSLETRLQKVLERSGQTAFKYAIERLYGLRCAFCDVTERRLIDAIHIRDHAKLGPMHVKNGLPACKNHHAAFDKGLIRIRPSDFTIEAFDDGCTLQSLGVTRPDLSHLTFEPAFEFVDWAYGNKRRRP